MEYWQWSTTFSIRQFKQDFCWSDSEANRWWFQDMASQVSVFQSTIFIIGLPLCFMLSFFFFCFLIMLDSFLLQVASTCVNKYLIFYYSYEFRLRVALGLGGDLMLTSRIRNTNADGKPFSFTFAYHTYFSVSDIRFVKKFLLRFFVSFKYVLYLQFHSIYFLSLSPYALLSSFWSIDAQIPLYEQLLNWKLNNLQTAIWIKWQG